MEIIEPPRIPSFDKDGHQGYVFPLEGALENIGILRVETETGHEKTIRQRECTFAYYVLKGDGYFKANGEEKACAEGDLVVIPPGDAFTFVGRMSLLLIANPPWRAEQEEVL